MFIQRLTAAGYAEFKSALSDLSTTSATLELIESDKSDRLHENLHSIVKVVSPEKRHLENAKKRVEFLIFQFSSDNVGVPCEWISNQVSNAAHRSRSVHNSTEVTLFPLPHALVNYMTSYLDMKSLLRLHVICLLGHDLTAS